MATKYSQDIKIDIEEFNFETVREIYTWIICCVEKQQLEETPQFNIRYKIGKISCTTDNYEEFIRDAYGIPIKISSFSLSYYKTGISFYVNRCYIDEKSDNKSIEITIYSTDRHVISQIVPSLEQIIKSNKSKKTNNTEQLPEIKIDVVGNLTMVGSSIGANNKSINIGKTSLQHETTQKTKDNFWKGVWQQIVANWIWYFMGLLCATILTYFGIDYLLK